MDFSGQKRPTLSSLLSLLSLLFIIIKNNYYILKYGIYACQNRPTQLSLILLLFIIIKIILIFSLTSLIIPSNYMFGITEWFRLQIMNLFTELPFIRMNEKEADYIGLILAKQSGFDINKGKTMWNKMTQVQGVDLQFVVIYM